MRREVRENCTVQKEFCETSHRQQRVDSATVLCQLEYEVECDDNDEEDGDTGMYKVMEDKFGIYMENSENKQQRQTEIF